MLLSKRVKGKCYFFLLFCCTISILIYIASIMSTDKFGLLGLHLRYLQNYNSTPHRNASQVTGNYSSLHNTKTSSYFHLVNNTTLDDLGNKVRSFEEDPSTRATRFLQTHRTCYNISNLPIEDYFHSNGLNPQGNATICDEAIAGTGYIKWAHDDVLSARRHELRYRHPHEPRIIGRLMDINERYVKSIILPLAEQALPLSEIDVSNFTIVTGCSRNHFAETNVTLQRLAKVFPNTTIVLYNLGGLAEKDVSWIKSFASNVAYRLVNYTNLPPHVKDLRTYAFKALTVALALQEFPAVLWLDASIYYEEQDLTSILTAVKTTGLSLLTEVSHSTFTVTFPLMFEYLPSEPNVTLLLQRQSGIVFYTRSHNVLKHVIRWWIYCALDPYCTGRHEFNVYSTGCFLGTRTMFARIHRYDQSSLNIVANNYFNYCPKLQFLKEKTVLRRFSEIKKYDL